MIVKGAGTGLSSPEDGTLQDSKIKKPASLGYGRVSPTHGIGKRSLAVGVSALMCSSLAMAQSQTPEAEGSYVSQYFCPAYQ